MHTFLYTLVIFERNLFNYEREGYNSMSKIRVDVDDLLEKLNEVKEDEYTTVELEIDADEYCSELLVSAVSFDMPEPYPYGSLAEIKDEI